MDIAAFIRGLALGVAVAAPVGPMSLLCMRRTLASGFVPGLLSGLGVAAADAAYGAIAAFGLAALTSVLVGQQVWLRLFGGVALLYVGIRTLRAGPRETATVAGGTGLAQMFASTLVLTLANPATIFSFVALFAGLGLDGRDRDATTAPAMVLGVFAGSALWWLVLTGAIAVVRRRLTGRPLRWIDTLSGLVLIGFGLAALATVLQQA